MEKVILPQSKSEGQIHKSVRLEDELFNRIYLNRRNKRSTLDKNQFSTIEVIILEFKLFLKT